MKVLGNTQQRMPNKASAADGEYGATYLECGSEMEHIKPGKW